MTTHGIQMPRGKYNRVVDGERHVILLVQDCRSPIQIGDIVIFCADRLDGDQDALSVRVRRASQPAPADDPLFREGVLVLTFEPVGIGEVPPEDRERFGIVADDFRGQR